MNYFANSLKGDFHPLCRKFCSFIKIMFQLHLILQKISCSLQLQKGSK